MALEEEEPPWLDERYPPVSVAEPLAGDAAQLSEDINKLETGLSAKLVKLGQELSERTAQAAARSTQALQAVQIGHERHLELLQCETQRREGAVTGLLRQVGNSLGSRGRVIGGRPVTPRPSTAPS